MIKKGTGQGCIWKHSLREGTHLPLGQQTFGGKQSGGQRGLSEKGI